MKILAKNKAALFNYELIREYEAGIVLEGWEVKSAKTGNVSLKESYVTVRQGEAWLVGAHISRWRGIAKGVNVNETQDRKLLLHKGEIDKLMQARSAEGLTIIVVNMYLDRNLIKVKLALARGKQRHDKRQKLKEKDMKRQIDRDLKKIGY